MVEKMMAWQFDDRGITNSQLKNRKTDEKYLLQGLGVKDRTHHNSPGYSPSACVLPIITPPPVDRPGYSSLQVDCTPPTSSIHNELPSPDNGKGPNENGAALDGCPIAEDQNL
jgi:hypothetical protein